MDNDYKQQNLEILEQHFRDGCKLNCVQKLGVEIEHIIVHRKTQEAVTYYEEHGIAWLLHQLKAFYPHHHYENESAWSRQHSWKSASCRRKVSG